MARQGASHGAAAAGVEAAAAAAAAAAGESRTEDYTQIPPEGEQHCNHETLERRRKNKKTCNIKFKRKYEKTFPSLLLPATYVTV